MFRVVVPIVLWVMAANAQSDFSFEEILPASCSSQSRYFDFGILTCGNCSTGQQVDSSGYSCSCQSDYAANVSSPRILQCRPCASGGTTPDGYFCSECNTANGTTTPGSCTCPANQALSITYNTAGTSTTSCSACSESFLASTGSQSCFPCPDCQQVCLSRAGYFTGGLCFDNGGVLSGISSDNIYINEHLAAAYGACIADQTPTGIKNQTACARLANLCVMELYSQTGSACVQYSQAIESGQNVFTITNVLEWRSRRLPWLYYESGLNPSILSDESISATYDFSPNTLLDLVVAQYRANGTYLGMQSVQNGLIQLCQDRNSVSNAAFEFGTYFQSNCTLAVSDLVTDAAADTYFSMYLRYTSSSGAIILHPVPVLVSNYQSSSVTVNQGSDSSEWQLVTRFFLVDTLSLESLSEVQYAEYMQLEIEIKPDGSTGSIYPPLLRMTYATASTVAGITVETSFNVLYKSSTTDQNEGLKISMSILGVFAVLYAFVEASGWRRNQGLPYIELTTIIHCVIFAMANIANMFFIVMFGYTTVLLLYFKGQMTATMYVPLNDTFENYLFFIFICTGFIFKAIHIIVMIFNQSFIDIFFIDWERPRSRQANNEAEKISIWRTYFVANEWNEIQTCRKVNTTFQLFAVVFFLEVVNFKNLALLNASSDLNPSSDTYQPGYSTLLRFSIGSLVFLIIELLQVLYFKLIRERFISDQMRDFVDLCSVSNVSVFILSQKAFGYYIHGRSVHGKADTDMAEMNLMMKREEEDLVPRRGLQQGSDAQVFEILIPYRMRTQYDKIYEPLQQFRAQPRNTGMGRDRNAVAENLKAYGVMKSFLTSFLDHSLKDLDFVILEKLFFEKILGIQFRDPMDSAHFTIGNDDAFSDILFYGNEAALFVFDVLLFSLVDYGSQNFILAAIITYLIGTFLRILRGQLARHNLASKTLIDKRFLI